MFDIFFVAHLKVAVSLSYVNWIGIYVLLSMYTAFVLRGLSTSILALFFRSCTLGYGKKGKVHRYISTEAIYRPYGP